MILKFLGMAQMDKFKKFKKEFIPERTSGWVIKANRVALGLTHDDLEEITGINASNISAYENNKKDIGKAVANKFAAALGILPQSILYPNGTYEEDKEILKIKERSRVV